MKKTTILCVFMLITGLAAYGFAGAGSPQPPPQPAPIALAGTWTGTFTFVGLSDSGGDNETDSVSITFTQFSSNSNLFYGQLSCDQTSCNLLPSTGDFSAIRIGNHVQMTGDGFSLSGDLSAAPAKKGASPTKTLCIEGSDLNKAVTFQGNLTKQ